eukprot:symbB.v1.2.002339.t1/scaffold121.1/size317807/3
MLSTASAAKPGPLPCVPKNVEGRNRSEIFPPLRAKSWSRGAGCLAVATLVASKKSRSRCERPCVRRGVSLTGDAESPHILRQWRFARRSRLMKTLDWTRYHLWIYFVDASEPSYARARLARYFFEKVCHSRDTSSLLYCAAGGIQSTFQESRRVDGIYQKATPNAAHSWIDTSKTYYINTPSSDGNQQGLIEIFYNKDVPGWRISMNGQEQYHADELTAEWTRYSHGVEPAPVVIYGTTSNGDSSTSFFSSASCRWTVGGEKEGLEVASAVPELHAEDLQNLAVPPWTFVPKDFNMYDVVVAVNEETARLIRKELPKDRDELCVLSDFVDAYDVMLEMEEEAKEVVTPRTLAPGMLTREGLAALKPGEPLRGTPPLTSVGAPLWGLPDGWQDLWNETQRSINSVPEETGADHPFDEAGRILHSIVGLERSLRASIPPDMRWWNDEV